MTEYSAEPEVEGETVWILGTVREQYVNTVNGLSFFMRIESQGNVRGDKCAVLIMVQGGEQQRP
jgi:hypothetical protein